MRMNSTVIFLFESRNVLSKLTLFVRRPLLRDLSKRKSQTFLPTFLRLGDCPTSGKCLPNTQ